MNQEKKRLAMAGCGKLAGIVAQAMERGLLDDYTFVGAMSRSRASAEAFASRVGCEVADGLDALIDTRPEIVVESASPACVREIALPLLKKGVSLVVLSIGAFADTAFYEACQQAARESGARIYIVSGAVGGFDVLRTVLLMGNVEASISTEKGPNSLKGTPLYEEALQREKKQVFSGTAREAIGLLPTKVNVAVATSLASAGPEETRVSVTSTPGFVGDDHRIEVKGPGVRALVDIYSETSEIAGWSVVNTLRNIVSPVVF
ncbi:aspartate dehydrogenase domain-containing protein [Beduinella massiliensis]|uniref:aspartate dehydrogenase domain-containing protein n=1 Tax=Beduinella massiliensis TaxID=1852363 RepID=UPI000C82F28F